MEFGTEDQVLSHFCELPAGGRDSGQKMSNPVGKSYYLQLANPCNPLCSSQKIPVLCLTIPRISGFAGWSKEDLRAGLQGFAK